MCVCTYVCMGVKRTVPCQTCMCVYVCVKSVVCAMCGGHSTVVCMCVCVCVCLCVCLKRDNSGKSIHLND